MATRLDVYKSAVQFAFDSFYVKDTKEVVKQGVARFEQDGFGNGDYEFWSQIANTVRTQMQTYAAQKASPAPVKG